MRRARLRGEAARLFRARSGLCGVARALRRALFLQLFASLGDLLGEEQRQRVAKQDSDLCKPQ